MKIGFYLIIFSKRIKMLKQDYVSKCDQMLEWKEIQIWAVVVAQMV